METQANLLLDRLKPLKMLEENLSRNLSEIKLLISQARKQAASVSVGPTGLGSPAPPRQLKLLEPHIPGVSCAEGFGHTFY